MIPDLPANIDQIKGFLAQDEAQALYEHASPGKRLGPVLEIGSYCGKSTIYLGLACRASSARYLHWTTTAGRKSTSRASFSTTQTCLTAAKA